MLMELLKKNIVNGILLKNPCENPKMFLLLFKILGREELEEITVESILFQCK